jgi:hypothetical protein
MVVAAAGGGVLIAQIPAGTPRARVALAIGWGAFCLILSLVVGLSGWFGRRGL